MVAEPAGSGMNYAADITGAEIMRTLRDEARNRVQDIKVLEFSPAVELILNEHGHCAGAVSLQPGDRGIFHRQGKSSGPGHGRVWKTPHLGIHDNKSLWCHRRRSVLGYRAGVKVCFLHTVQYHPTGVAFPEQAEGILITEKFRGAGANVLNIDGEQFVTSGSRGCGISLLHPGGNRDRKGHPDSRRKSGIWLDSPIIDILMGEGAVKREFPGSTFC